MCLYEKLIYVQQNLDFKKIIEELAFYASSVNTGWLILPFYMEEQSTQKSRQYVP